MAHMTVFFFGQNLCCWAHWRFSDIFPGILPFQLMFSSNGNIQWHQSNAVPYGNVFPTCTRQTYDPLLCMNQVNYFNTQPWQQSSSTYWNNCPPTYERECVQQPCTHSTINSLNQTFQVSFTQEEETKVLRRMT